MDGLSADFRFALRQLTRSPGFALVVVVILGLGLGANTAIFSLVDAVLLRPLAYPEAERLVQIFGTVPERHVERGWTSPLNFVDLQGQAGSFEAVGAWHGARVTLSGAANARRLQGASVSAGVFRALRTEAAMGHAFTPDEDRPGGERVVLLSHGLWRQQFGADPGVVGGEALLDGKPATIVGVMPAGFDFPEGAELWLPLQLDPGRFHRGSNNLSIVARLTEEADLEQAQADVGAVARRLADAYPEVNGGRGFAVVPLKEELIGEIRPALLVLATAVGLVLLMACANLANLLLARSVHRGTEMAMRRALGAGRWRIVRQLVIENLVLALLAVLLGVVAGSWGARVLTHLGSQHIPRLAEVGLDARVVAFALGLGMLAVVLLGLAPALQVSGSDLQAVLKEGRAAGSARGRKVSRLLMVAEVMLSLTLMIGAGLLIKSFLRLTRVDPGFEPSHVLTLDVSPPDWKYDPATALGLYERMLARLEALPGVVSAAGVMSRPILSRGGWGAEITVEGRPRDDNEILQAAMNPVTTRYFGTLGIPLVDGRAFEDSDELGKPGVAILSASAARLFFPGENPVGRVLTHDLGFGPAAQTRTVVGVVGDVRQSGLDSDEVPIIYVPHRQMPYPELSLVIRTRTEPLSLAAAVRRALWELEPEVPLEEVTTLRSILSRSTSEPRLYMVLLAAFAGVALVLAAVGVYGVLSHSVARRRHEIGVRMALGAGRGDILLLVAGRILALAGGGLVLGVAGALALSRLMASLLYGVEATDPSTYVTVAGVLAGVVLLACYLPALRATRLDPMETLRVE